MKPTGLEGNGVALVRERALASAVQRGLERLYQLDRVADVHDYVELAEDGEREALFVRESEGGALEIALRIPSLGRREIDMMADADLDPLCQIIEGVSHFVYLTDRAAASRETTQLELELQAEVDKYIVLAASLGGAGGTRGARLRERLYARVGFLDGEETERGERYRLANTLAARFTQRLEHDFMSPGRYRELRVALRRFFRVGQEEKLRMSKG